MGNPGPCKLRKRPSEAADVTMVNAFPRLAAGPRSDESVAISRRRLFLAVAAPLFAVYLLTATWGTPTINDTYTNTLSAWNLGTEGSFYLRHHEQLIEYRGWKAWVVDAGDTAVSMYPPGVSLIAAPLYALWPEPATPVTFDADRIPWGLPRVDLTYLEPPPAPAVLAAAGSTAAAAGILAVVALGLGASRRSALGAGYLAGLGTAAWAVASDQLWQHGPAMLWIMAGLALAARRPLASGSAWALAILTRPPVALIAAAVGLTRGWQERNWRPVFLIGTGAGAGLLAYLFYNLIVFGELSVGGGYGTGFQERSLAAPGSDYLENLFQAGFSLHRGLFIWSPFLLVLIPGLRAAWRAAPAWVRGGAIGGLLYLLVQYKANRYTGGFAFPTYRYPLEGLTAMAPLLYLSYSEWVARRPRAQLGFVALALLSVSLQFLGAIDLVPLLVAA